MQIQRKCHLLHSWVLNNHSLSSLCSFQRKSGDWTRIITSMIYVALELLMQRAILILGYNSHLWLLYPIKRMLMWLRTRQPISLKASWAWVSQTDNDDRPDLVATNAWEFYALCLSLCCYSALLQYKLQFKWVSKSESRIIASLLQSM